MTRTITVASAALVAALLGTVASRPVLAGETVIAPGDIGTAQIELEDDDELTVGAGGALSVTGDPAVYVNNADTGVLIDNAGTISSSNDRAIESDDDDVIRLKIVNREGATISGDGDAIKVKADEDGTEGEVVIENSGLIVSVNDGQALDLDDLSDSDLTVSVLNTATGVIRSTAKDAVRPGAGTLTNYGRILAFDGADSKSDGVDLQENEAEIFNYGEISGARHGITADTDLIVENHAGATITGRNGSGVGSDGDGTVTNHGTITGAVDDISEDGDGDGIDIDGYADITNYGTIRGIGARGEKDGSPNTSEGIAAGGGEILNLGEASLISGLGNGILIDDSDAGAAPNATHIANEGTIEGLNGYGIRLVGDQDDQVSNSGTISGSDGLALDMGGGDDTLTVVTGAVFKGRVTGGAGTDTIHLDGFEKGTFHGAEDFEDLSVQGGEWTLVGDQSLSRDVNLEGGSLAIEGTLNVGGDFKQLTGAVYTVTVDASGRAGLIDVAGTATLGGTVSVADASGAYLAGESYTILSAGNAISTGFDTLETPDDLPFLSFALAYDTNDVKLDVTRSSTGFADVATNSNQRRVARAIEALGGGVGLYDALSGLNTADARKAFESLSGGSQASAATAMVLETGDLRAIVNGRVRTSLGSAPSGAIATHGDNPGEPLGGNVWGRAVGSVGTVGAGLSSMDRSSAGLMAGIDMPLGEMLRLGLAAGYGRSFYDVDDLGSSANSENYTVAAYGGAYFGATTLSFGASHTWHSVESLRSAALGATVYRAQASYDARTLQIFGEIDHAIPFHGVTLDPYAGLAYVGVHSDGYRETTVAGLRVDSARSDLGMTTAGLRVSSAFQLLDGVDATVSGGLGWRHAFGDVTPVITAAFAGGNAFQVSGTPIAEDAALVEAGLELAITPEMHFDADYSGQFAEDSRDHSFTGRLSLRF